MIAIVDLIVCVLQVIFLALDVHEKNVTSTYSLEHTSIDTLFDSIFFRLNAILEENDDQNVSEKPFQELVFCVGTIQTFISKHMIKEEQQVRALIRNKPFISFMR